VNAVAARTFAQLCAKPAIAVPVVAFAIAGAVAENRLAQSGFSSWTAGGGLFAQGATVFNAYAATIAALGLRVLFGLAVTAATAGIVNRMPLRILATRTLETLAVLLLAGLAAAALAVPTFGISMLLFVPLSLFAVAIAAKDRRSAPEAIVDAIAIMARNAGPALVLAVGVLVCGIAGVFAARLIPVPMAGALIAWLVLEAATACAAVAVAGTALC
jgi:hypothetical protein